MGIGALAFCRFTVSTFLYLSGGIGSPKNPRSYGSWVVITGATDGIGKALCFEFAKKGMNIFLISRTESKLQATAKEIKDTFGNGIQTKYLPIDFGKFDENARDKVKEELNSLPDIGILVNNVGMSYPFPLFFHELTDEDVKGMLELNITSTTFMSKIILPFMVEKKNGLILNIGSAAGLHPSPLLAQYSAAKAYVETFSHSLHTEYKSFGICVQAHVPLFIVSKLSKYKKPSAFIPSPETYAKECMQTLGKGPVVSPHFLHRVASYILDCVPETLLQPNTLKMHLGIRSKGLKKREREAAAAK